MNLEDCFNFFGYKSVDIDEIYSPEDMTFLITNNFFSCDLDVCMAFIILKKKIKLKYPKLFPNKTNPIAMRMIPQINDFN